MAYIKLNPKYCLISTAFPHDHSVPTMGPSTSYPQNIITGPAVRKFTNEVDASLYEALLMNSFHGKLRSHKIQKLVTK